jgi:hypothetical protein
LWHRRHLQLSKLTIFVLQSFKQLCELLLLLHLLLLLLLQRRSQALALVGINFGGAAQCLHVIKPPKNCYCCDAITTSSSECGLPLPLRIAAPQLPLQRDDAGAGGAAVVVLAAETPRRAVGVLGCHARAVCGAAVGCCDVNALTLLLQQLDQSVCVDFVDERR